MRISDLKSDTDTEKDLGLENNDNNSKVRWPFILQIPTILFLPVIALWSTTPTNVLNASDGGRALESFGLLGEKYIFYLAIPFGIIGRRYVKKRPGRLGNLERPTKVLALINIVAGALEIGLLIIIFLGVMFGGISV